MEYTKSPAPQPADSSISYEEQLAQAAAILPTTAHLYGVEIQTLRKGVTAASRHQRRAIAVSGQWWSIPQYFAAAAAARWSLLILYVLFPCPRAMVRFNKSHLDRVLRFALDRPPITEAS